MSRLSPARIGSRPLSLLNERGSLKAGITPPLDDPQVLDALRLMMLARALDERAILLNRQGRIGVYGPVHGQEASVVGACFAIDPERDWLVPAYREQPAMLRQGYPLRNLLAGHMGKVAGSRIPDLVNMLPRQQSVAAQMPHAVGLAWGMKLQGKDSVVMTYLGEGATSEGDFHESCNLAGVVKAPVIFVIQNNGWAISTPATKQSAAVTLASRAEGYGFPGIVVDGNDLFAVHVAAREAVDRARVGDGPTMIECRTFRMGSHNTSDNPRRYRNQAQEEAAKTKDPITRIERYLMARNVFDGAVKASWLEAISAEIEAAVQDASELPQPGLGDIFTHVYASIPPRLITQWQSMRRVLDI